MSSCTVSDGTTAAPVGGRPDRGGRLGAPPVPARPGVLRKVLLLVLRFAVIFPLVGASLVAVVLLDLLVVQRVPALRAALS